MKTTFRLIAATSIWFFLVFCTLAEGNNLTLNVGNAEWPPWQIVDGDDIKGITADLLEEIITRTEYTFNIKILPQNRMLREFEQGKIDMESTTCRSWRKSQADISVYTIPFYTTGDIILVNKGRNIRAHKAEDFAGLSLGCDLGYFYPEGFQKAFEKGEIIRRDNRSTENNLIMLSLKRIDGVIIDRIQARYLFKHTKLNPDDFEIAYTFKPSNISMRLQKKHRCLLPGLNKAIEAMKNDGTIDLIVARYIH